MGNKERREHFEAYQKRLVELRDKGMFGLEPEIERVDEELRRLAQ